MVFNAKEKFQAMLRAYKKLEKINTNNGNSIDLSDAKDLTEEFFNQAYHFKDWLKKDQSIVINNNVEEFINSSPSLALASDYCNSFKHAGLDRKERSGKKIIALNTDTYVNLTPNGFVTSSKVRMTLDTGVYDVFDLATKCVDEWGRFLLLNNLDFS